jgi:hypothetical protein
MLNKHLKDTQQICKTLSQLLILNQEFHDSKSLVTISEEIDKSNLVGRKGIEPLKA